MKVSAGAEVSYEARLGKDPFPNSSGGQQHLFPGGLWIEASFSYWLWLTVPCYVGP